MRIDKQVITAVITFIVGFGLISTSTVSIADDAQVMERCYGIVKAGKSDCDTNLPSCPDQPLIDADPNYWIYLPKGVCERIVGGMVKRHETTSVDPESTTGAGNSPSATTTNTESVNSNRTKTNELTPNSAVQY